MTFEEWFNEIENYSLRGERFYLDLDVFGEKFMEDGLYVMNIDAYEPILKWLKAAYEVGYEEGCKDTGTS